MKLYIAERTGVYSQGILGVFTTLDKAQEICITAKKLEKDNYHTFNVKEIELNGLYQHPGNKYNFSPEIPTWELDNDELLFSKTF